MNETMNTSPAEETTVDTSEGFGSTAETEEDDWDDMDLSDLTDDSDAEENPVETQETHQEADQPQEENQEPSAEDQPTQDDPQTQGKAEADQPTFDLKYMGQTRTVSQEEVKSLAQKGLNYDKVLGERDTARREIERLGGIPKLQEYKDFLEELAKEDGSTVEDLMDSARAEILAKREHLDKTIALQRVKLDRERKAYEAQKSKDQAAQRAREEAERERDAEVDRFVKAFPGVKEVPAQVWQRVHQEGVPLTVAYASYELQRLRSENETLKTRAETAEQNLKNKERSTGSQSSAGKTSPKDVYDDLWYDGT